MEAELARARGEVERVRADARAALADALRRAGTDLVLYRPTQIEPHPARRR
ncbi:MAG: hypothetical protein ACRDZ4_01470 [Egibacteraceae bacterium]